MTENPDKQNLSLNSSSLPGSGYLPLRVLAEKYGYAKDHIGALARSGRIQAIRYGNKGEWFALESSVASYRSSQKARFETLVPPGVSAKPKSDDLTQLVSQLREIVSSATPAVIVPFSPAIATSEGGPVLSHNKGSLSADSTEPPFRINTALIALLAFGGIFLFAFFAPIQHITLPISELQQSNIFDTLKDGILSLFGIPTDKASQTLVVAPSPTPQIIYVPYSSGPSSGGSSPTYITNPTTIINHQITITQNISPEQLDSLRKEFASTSQLDLTSINKTLSDLTTSVGILQSITGRTAQAPILPGTQNPNNTLSFGPTNFGGSVSVLGDLSDTGNFTTKTLNVSGVTALGSDLSVGGNLTVSGSGTIGNQFSIVGSASLSGKLSLSKSPTIPHTGTWPSFSNPDEATVYINVLNPVADGNIFAYANNGSPKFLVDAEGDIYGNNLILTGSTTTATQTVGDLLVEGNSQFGDATGDKIKFVGTIESKTLASVTFAIQASASQTADLFRVQDVNTNSLFKISNLGNASLSANFELTGTASIGGNTTLAGMLISNSIGSNSFAGSLDISKGLRANYITATSGLLSNSISAYNAGPLTINAFTLGGLVTGNNQSISGINQFTSVNGFFTDASVSNNFEIGNVASIGGNILTKGIVSSTNTGSNSFSGSINSLLGIHGSGNLTTLAQFFSSGTGSNSFAGSLDLLKGLRTTNLTGASLTIGAYTLAGNITGNAFNITGLTQLTGSIASLSSNFEVGGYASIGGNAYIKGNVGIGNTAPVALLDVGTASINGGALPSNTQVFVRGTFTGGGGDASYNGLQLGVDGNRDYGALLYTRRDTGGLVHTQIGVRQAGTNIIGMDITSTGNIGIGTTAPGFKLDIADATANGRGINVLQTGATGTNYGGVFQVSGGATLNIAGYFGATGATTNYGVRIINPPAGANNWALFSDSPAQSYFAGNLGIGTTAPTQKLDVVGDIYVEQTGTNYATIRFQNTNGIIQSGKNAAGTGDDTLNIINGTALLSVRNNGNVGIGTTNPAGKLNVDQGDTSTPSFLGTLNAAANTNVFYAKQLNGGGNNLTASALYYADNRGVNPFLAFKNNTTDKFYIDNAGGVYSASGYYGLQLQGDSYTLNKTYSGASNAQTISITQTNAGGDTTTGSSLIKIDNRGANPTFYSSNNGSTPFIITAGGAVGIGTTVPGEKLDVAGNLKIEKSADSAPGTGYNPMPSYIQKFYGSFWNQSVGATEEQVGAIYGDPTQSNVGSTPVMTRLTLQAAAAGGTMTDVFTIYGNGNATLAGALTQNSDQRLKTNVIPLASNAGLSAINQLNPVSFTRIDQPGNGIQIGFIAQEVQQIFPQLVSISTPTELTPNGTFALNYIGLIPPVIKAIQELNTKVSSQSTAFETLQARVASLSVTVDQLLHSASASSELDPMMALRTTDGRVFALSGLFGFILDQLQTIGVTIHDGVVQAKEFIAEKVTTNELNTQKICIDGTCIEKDQLKTILQNSGISSTPTPTPDITPTPTPEVSPTPTPEIAPEPTASPSPEATPTPEPEITPSESPTPSPEI